MPSSSLGPLERDVMNIVWNEKQITVRGVWEKVQPQHRVAYTTVLTILSRLFKKGIVNRQKKGKSFTYAPKADRQQTVQSLIRQTITNLVDRFGDEAVAAFIDEVDDLHKKKKSHS
jgi:predicted transcriptional regulator